MLNLDLTASNLKSLCYTEIIMVSCAFWFIVFYSISTLGGYLMPNLVYTYILNIL